VTPPPPAPAAGAPVPPSALQAHLAQLAKGISGEAHIQLGSEAGSHVKVDIKKAGFQGAEELEVTARHQAPDSEALASVTASRIVHQEGENVSIHKVDIMAGVGREGQLVEFESSIGQVKAQLDGKGGSASQIKVDAKAEAGRLKSNASVELAEVDLQDIQKTETSQQGQARVAGLSARFVDENQEVYAKATHIYVQGSKVKNEESAEENISGKEESISGDAIVRGVELERGKVKAQIGTIDITGQKSDASIKDESSIEEISAHRAEGRIEEISAHIDDVQIALKKAKVVGSKYATQVKDNSPQPKVLKQETQYRAHAELGSFELQGQEMFAETQLNIISESTPETPKAKLNFRMRLKR